MLEALISSLAETDKLAKLILDAPGTNMDAAYKQNGVAIDEMSSNSHIRRVWDFARNLRVLREILVSTLLVLLYAMSQLLKDTSYLYFRWYFQVVQYEGKYLEDVNLIKIWLSWTKNACYWTVMVQMLKAKGIDLNIDDISLNDKATYDLISTGNTYGIFQIWIWMVCSLFVKIATRHIRRFNCDSCSL